MVETREHALITSENHRATGVEPLKFQDDMLILSTGNSIFLNWNDAKWAKRHAAKQAASFRRSPLMRMHLGSGWA